MERRSEKKILLMGDAGSGKSSMRAVIFNNSTPDLTERLVATNSYELEYFRFFGNTTLNLFDCGGQRGYFESYLSEDGQHAVFAHASAMIYVFEVTKLDDNGGRPPEETIQYYKRCLSALQKHSPNALVFILVQKMDLISPRRGQQYFAEWIEGIRSVTDGVIFRAFGTSIYEDTLYRAWSIIIRTLVPNVDVLTNDLDIFTQDCGAVESAIFEKNTFLLVARSSVADISVEGGALFATNGPQAEAQIVEAPKPGEVGLSNKFEVISKLMKAFKNDLKKHSGEPFEALRMRTADFTLVLDELTQTSYIVVITSADTRTRSDAILFNIERAKQQFNKSLQDGNS